MSRVCVIGAGLGGLALAIRLQSSGVETTLIEAHERPGGHSWSRAHDGFTFDFGPAALADPAAFAELWQLSGGDISEDIKLLPLELLHRYNWPDGAAIDMAGGPDDSGAAMRREVARVAPDDAAGYEEFLRWSQQALRDGATPWLSAPHTSRGTSCMPSYLCAISERRRMKPTCGPLPCPMATSQPCSIISAMCTAVSLAAKYWLSTLICFSSIISELPPMAITANFLWAI